MEKQSRLDSFLSNPSKSLWTMALPIIAGMMVQTLFNVVDIMFIGWLGAEEVTAVAFVSPLFFIIIGLTVGLGAGVTASIAQFIGQKDKKNAWINIVFLPKAFWNIPASVAPDLAAFTPNFATKLFSS